MTDEEVRRNVHLLNLGPGSCGGNALSFCNRTYSSWGKVPALKALSFPPIQPSSWGKVPGGSSGGKVPGQKFLGEVPGERFLGESSCSENVALNVVSRWGVLRVTTHQEHYNYRCYRGCSREGQYYSGFSVLNRWKLK